MSTTIQKTELIETIKAGLTDVDSIDFFKDYTPKKCTGLCEIKDGSLVKLKMNKKENWYLITPIEGGKMIKHNDNIVMTITPFSLLGKALIDLKMGQTFKLEDKSFEIVNHL
ncbi:MAG: hypothetical protein ACI9QD_000513 [Thermoproteota archaeon]|jgi:hypothetical protein